MSPRFGMHRAAQVRNPAKPHTGVASNDGIRCCGLFEYWRWSGEISSRSFPELFSPLSHVVANPVVQPPRGLRDVACDSLAPATSKRRLAIGRSRSRLWRAWLEMV